MPAIVTNDNRILAADYFQNNIDRNPMYIYIGGTTAWPDETLPPDVTDTVKDKIDTLDELLGLKRIRQSDMISVVRRINWTNNTIFDEYRSDVNLIDQINPITDTFYNFYVVTDEFNVYKCISNNRRVNSTVKPSGTSAASFTTPDGYIWKYMYTIRSNDAFDFMSPNWIPCYTIYYNDASAQWNTQSSAIEGSIEHIYLTNQGATYNTANPPVVTITGDGVGATAIAEVDNETGLITRILMTDIGSGYTEATVAITNPGGTGIGASAQVVISPKGGHGSDARSELGAIYKMIQLVLDGTEGAILPINVEYRKSGILNLPLSINQGTILVTSESRLYAVGQTVTGTTSGATGVITSISEDKNYLYVGTVTGVFIQGEEISSTVYNASNLMDIMYNMNVPLTEDVVAAADYLDNSGQVLYFSTRERIFRSADQQESIRFIIQF